MSKEFQRRNWNRHVRIGKGKRKQSWRKPRGRHNKIREKRRGYAKPVGIGHKKSREKAGRKKLIVVRNLSDLENFTKSDTVRVGKVGMKKKIELAKKAEEMKISIKNLDIKKLLKKDKKNETK